MKLTSILLACLAAVMLFQVSVSAMESSLSPAESILLEAAQRHTVTDHATAFSDSDAETEGDVAVDSHILSDAEAEAEARFQADSDSESEMETTQEVDAAELAAAEESAALDADAEIENRMDADTDMDADMESESESDMPESFAELSSESESDMDAAQEEEFLAGEAALIEMQQAQAPPADFNQPPANFQQGPPPNFQQGPPSSDFQGPPPSFQGQQGPAPGGNFAPNQQAPFGGPAGPGAPGAANELPPGIEVPIPAGSSAGADLPLPPGINPKAPFPFKEDKEATAAVASADSKATVVVKVPNPAAPGKFLKVRVPVPTKGKLAKKMAKGKGKKTLAKQLKKAVKKALGKNKLNKSEKKAVKKAAKKAVKKAKKAAKKAKKAKKALKKKAAKKAAKKSKKKKLSKKARRAKKLAKAATKAATLNKKLLPKGKYTKRWISIQVPNPAKAGSTVAAKVQVSVPVPSNADEVLKSISTIVPKVELRKLKLPGSKAAKEIKVTRFFKALRQAVVDPINAGETRTVDVQVEVKAPAKKPAAAIDEAGQLLESRISKISKNIKKLERGLNAAKKNVADSPVLEDGAPAPPDRQQVEMAANLMKVLEATVLGRAKAIGEKYLSDARDMTVLADANHEAVQDFNIRMNAAQILPKDF